MLAANLTRLWVVNMVAVVDLNLTPIPSQLGFRSLNIGVKVSYNNTLTVAVVCRECQEVLLVHTIRTYVAKWQHPRGDRRFLITAKHLLFMYQVSTYMWLAIACGV